MRRALAAFACFALAVGAAAQEAARTPAEMARLLQDVQAQVASGAPGGAEALVGVLEAMGEKFAGFDPAVWREPRHARAAALFVFSGGDPAVARRILDSGGLAEPEAKLLRGALAHVGGRATDAGKLFADIDPRGLDASLGAHVAFAQAGMAKDGAQARRALELARLLAPGGLVDEAALRREIFLAGESGDAAAFAELSRRYARRFRGSAYFDNFAQKFVVAAAAFPLSTLEPVLPALDDATRALAPAQRSAFLLALARRALLEGRSDLGGRAARDALAIAGADAASLARARLYAAAAAVVAGGGTATALPLADDQGFDAQDRALLAAARVGAAAATRAPKPSRGAGAGEAVGDVVGVIARARGLLDETADLVGAPIR